MVRTIAVANMKGGVGKTTLSIMLAEALAHRGKSVLLVDLDAQGSLSFALMGDERFEQVVEARKTVSQYFADRIGPRERPLADYITKQASLLATCKTLDLVAAEPGLQSGERDVISHLTRFAIGNAFKGSPERVASAWLKEEVGKLTGYEYVVFDCPPGISIFAFAGIQNSSTILIPATPDYLSMLAIRSMQARVIPDAIKGRPRKQRPSLQIVLNKCRGTTNAPGRYRQRISEFIAEKKWDATLVDIQIPLQEKIARAVEADEEERTWNTFGQKYESFYTDELAKLFVQ